MQQSHETPLFRLEILFIVLTTTLANIIDILNIFPSLVEYLSVNLPNIVPVLSVLSSKVSLYLFEIIGSVTGALLFGFLIRFWQLGPNHQLITPRLSAQAVHEMAAREAGKITLSDLDWLKRGGIGALGALVFDPTFILSGIAAVIGLLTFMFKDSFGEKKRKAKERIWLEVSLGFQELDTSVNHWLSVSERVANAAMMRSIVANCTKLSTHLISFKPERIHHQAA